jgi:hypothetical protein
MLSAADIHPQNPMRPPDWRWLRAEQLAATKRNCSRHREDDATCRAVKYLRALHRYKTQRGIAGLAERMPDLHLAHLLQAGTVPEKWIIQGRTLARQTSVEISRLVPVAPEVIELYTRLFFDVGDRLNARCYIQKAAIGFVGLPRPAWNPAGVLLRQFGYNGGPLVLDLVTPVILGPLAKDIPTSDAAASPDDLRTRKIRLLITLLTMPGNETSIKTLRVLFDLWKSTQAGGGVNETTFLDESERALRDYEWKCPVEVQVEAVEDTETPDVAAEIRETA